MHVFRHRLNSSQNGQTQSHPEDGGIEENHLAMDFPHDVGMNLAIIRHSDALQVVLSNTDKTPEVKYLYPSHPSSTARGRMTAS